MKTLNSDKNFKNTLDVKTQIKDIFLQLYILAISINHI